MPNLPRRTLLTTILLAAAALSYAAADARAQQSAKSNQNAQPPAASTSSAASTPPAATKAERAPDANAERAEAARAATTDNAAATTTSADATEAAPSAAPARAAAVREDAAFFTSPARAADTRLFADAQPAVASPVGQSGGASPDAAQTTSQSSSQSSAPSGYTPLTGEQKMKRAAKNAFLSPAGYARTAFSSIWTQWNEDSQPHKTTEDEVADGASRFAINFGRRATRSLLGGGVFPVLFRQDPRYERAEEGKGAGYRAGWAVSRVFVTRGDGGGHQPNVSNWAGSLSASAISNLWERSTPGHDRIGTDATFKRFARNFFNDAINNLLREFWPDIRGIFGR